MYSDFLKKNIKSQASCVQYGYGQVEPNHLSARYNGQIYAQLPADKTIEVLEQGQFVKYDYEKGLVNFTGKGPWMLVYNEIKLYRDGQWDCEFALVRDNYNAHVYSPFGAGLDKSGKPTSTGDTAYDRQSRYYNGKDSESNTEWTIESSPETKIKYSDVTKSADYHDPFATEDPFHIEGPYQEAMMPEGTKMVPRVFATAVGDIFTTNTIDAKEKNPSENPVKVGDILVPSADKGILTVTEELENVPMQWQVVKVYTMPDHQPGYKIMRIA